MNDISLLLNREKELFNSDIQLFGKELSEIISLSSFLVLGGAGSIGQAVVKEIFSRNPKKLHVVDISENNLVELVRDLRSSVGYINGEFKTYSLDIGSKEYDYFINSDGKYDYVLNLSALKHVRSEKDIYTLMRMINVNIFNTEKTLKQSIQNNVKKYFCVSTDKAANPVNMMGASKRIMEMFLMKYANEVKISTARFANVAFSDGSLLYGFDQRLKKGQPLSAPRDIKRYFVTPRESGLLCLMSCIFGDNMDIFFPKLDKEIHLISFSEIAKNYLKSKNMKAILCQSEQEARDFNIKEKYNEWPCYFFESDTTGEKGFEEFYMANEKLDMHRFDDLGIVKNAIKNEAEKVDKFKKEIYEMQRLQQWNKSDLLNLFYKMVPEFEHIEKGKSLDEKM